MANKWSVIVIVLFLLLGAGIWKLQSLDRDDPELACAEAGPGDPSCMTAKEFTQWCLQQENFEGAPQCEGEFGNLKSKILLLILKDEKVKTYNHIKKAQKWPLYLPKAVLWDEQREVVLNSLESQVQFVEEEDVNGESVSVEKLGVLKDGHFFAEFSIPSEGVQGQLKGQIIKGKFNVDSLEVVEH